MPEHSHKPNFKEVLPKKGLLFQEDVPHLVLCKPKLMPIKSVTLEKLDKMQKESEAKIRLHSLQPQN